MQVGIRLGVVCLFLGIAAMVASGQQPGGQPAKQPQAKPAEKPADRPAGKSVQKPAQKPVEKPVGKPAAGEPSPGAVPGPENAKFDRIFKDWKALLAQLRTLYEEYKVAEPTRRTEIEKEYADLIAKGEQMEPEVVSAAEKAYLEAPNANPQLGQFLLAMVANQVQRDNYEEALRLAKMLIEKRCPDKRIYNWAGYASFCVGYYDAAETYFKLAQQNHVPLRVGKPLLQSIVADFLKNPEPYKEAWNREQQLRQAEAKADDLPRVLLRTNKGDITVELFENEAPNTVANFISLVEKGFYDGTVFHRVLDGFMAQGGSPHGDGRGGPGYSIRCECYQPNHRQHFRGSLSMAHAGRDTGGSQFFLTFIPTTTLDGKHTVFGRVISGMDVLSKIRRRDPEKRHQPKPDKLIEAKVLRKRSHPYVPIKVGEETK